MKHKVAIIVLNWNGRENLRNCLASLAMTDYPNYEIVVVDDASTDGSVKMVSKEFPKAHLLCLTKNLGYAGGNNAGIRYAKERLAADYFVIQNNDTIITDKDWLIHMVGVANTLQVTSQTFGLAKQKRP